MSASLGILLIATTALLTAYMAYRMVAPFLEERGDQLRFELLDEELRQIEELTNRKKLNVDGLRELELDHELERISDEDYRVMKKRYELETIRIMRELDALHGGRGWEERVEDALRRALDEEPASREDAAPALATEATEASAPEARAEVECPSCGKMMEADARFCSGCGASLQPIEPADDAEGVEAARAS